MNRDLAFPADGRLPAAPGAFPAATVATRGARQTQGPQLDVATLLRILREWRWLILAAAVTGLAVGIVVTMLTTPLYRASATLEVNPPKFDVVADGKDISDQSQQSWDLIATQIGLLRSRSVAERTAQDLNLAANPAVAGSDGTIQQRIERATNTVAGTLDVEQPKEGTLIRYHVVHPNPQLAATIANGVADSFINSALQRRFESSAYARRFLERQIVKTRADLEKSERELAAYAQSQGIITFAAGGGGGGGGSGGSSEAGNSLLGESLAALNGALAEATARRVAAEGAYRAAASAGATADVNASTAALRQARAALEAEYSEKRTELQPEHPDMISLRTRIDSLNGQIARESAQVSSGRNNTLAQDYRAAAAAENALRAKVAGLKGEVLDLRGRSVRYGILQRDVDTNRALYDSLLGRFKEIGVAGGIGTAAVSVVDRATVPGAPFKPNLPFNLLAGLGLGLLGGIGAAVGLDLLRDTIRTREDMRSKLGLACLGTIPKRPGKTSLLDEIEEPGSPVSEAYGSVAAALRFATEHGTPRTLMVTSTTPAEGKSSSALSLAQNFARRGAAVLLIDADLRKPAFRGAGEGGGLSALLTNDESIFAQVHPTQFENLSLLSSGTLPPNPADLLSTSRLGALLEEALTRFDMVIVDAPPVMGLADAPLIAHAASNVLFVVESGRTRTRPAIEALNALDGSGAHLLGGILNKATDAGGNYGYYSYRYEEVADRRPKIVLIPHHQDA